MSNQRTIPNDSTFNVVAFSITSEGSAISPTYQVISVSVIREVNRIPVAKIVLRDGDPASEEFAISSAADFEPGKTLEIKVGRDKSTATIFKGIVVKQKAQVRQECYSTLMVECRDEAVKMTIGRKSKYFEKKKDSDIMKAVLSEYGLAGTVEATSLQHAEVVQHRVTDWDFVLSRAEMNGMLVVANDGKVDVKKPDTGGTAALQLIYGSTLLEFEAEMDARHQFKEVKASSWSYKDQKMEEAKATSTSYADHGNLSGSDLSKVVGLKSFELRHSGQVLKEELQAWAEAQMLKSRLSKIRGRAKCKGYEKIQAGDIVELSGVGDRFGGNAFVTGVRQEMVNGSWFTHIQFGQPIEWFHQNNDVVEPAAGGLVPAIHGLQIGKVVHLQEDPDGEDRILVKLPVVDDQAKGVWARVGTLDAGKERGSFFRPEIDDEVIVGFINGDPRDPVVLGMLHSSKLPAPIQPEDTNHYKGFVTRSKMRIWFDDEKKIMTLDTPAENKIEISEDGKSITIEDQNKNKIVMDDKGIQITSPKDIKIEATGKIEAKATQDLKAEGLNVGIKASAQFKAEGGAGAELSTSAIATVKGSLVKIN